MNSWLLVDANSLANRAYYAVGQEPALAAHVMFRELFSIMDVLGVRDVAWCFDGGASKRIEILPTYKESRKERHAAKPKAEQESRSLLNATLNSIRENLESAGYRNVFHAPGYEADDLIAMAALAVKEDEEAVIVSSDHDLFQLINARVIMWHLGRKRAINLRSFVEEFDIRPSKWAFVKAMAGCSTDDIPGIEGVGEILAARYVSGALGENTKAYKAIRANTDLCQRNLKLVHLPFPGTPECALHKDEVTRGKWQRFCKEMGFELLKDLYPFPIAGKG